MDALTDSLPIAAPQHEPVPLPPVGSIPLRNRKHERYSRLISLLQPKLKAYIEAFEMNRSEMTDAQVHCAQGNASRLEHRKDVKARIAWLSRQEEELLAQKRERLESWQWAILEHNPADFYEIAERPLFDAKGKPILDKDGEFIMIKYQRARFLQELSPEALAAVEGLQITESGKVMVKTYSKMQANKELRALLGIGTTTSQTSDDFSEMTTTQIVAELNALGVDVKIGVSVTHER